MIVAGGLETMSMIPMGGHIIRPNPYLVEHYPDFYLNMGLATENVARKYERQREEQDEFALAFASTRGGSARRRQVQGRNSAVDCHVRRAGRER